MLFEALRSDESEYVRETIFNKLREDYHVVGVLCGDERAMEMLLEILKSDKDVRVKLVAASAVLDYFIAQKELEEDKAIDVVTQTLESVIYYNSRYDLEIFEKIIELLRRVGNDRAVEIMIMILSDIIASWSMTPLIVVPEDGDGGVLELIVEQIVNSLVDLKGEEILNTLIDFLFIREDGCEAYRKIVAKALERINPELVIDRILKIFQEDELIDDCSSSSYLTDSDPQWLYYYQEAAYLLGVSAAKLSRYDLVLNNLSIGKVITENLVNGFVQALRSITPSPELFRTLHILRSHPHVQSSPELVKQIDELLVRGSEEKAGF